MGNCFPFQSTLKQNNDQKTTNTFKVNKEEFTKQKNIKTSLGKVKEHPIQTE